MFNDDKKTDLIGEAWVDLKAIIVPGGGQSDMWQSLTYRGKYAGEIRIEITYYDSRPKPEKQPVRARQSLASEQEVGSSRQNTPVKRRPLPSDPVTGEAPPPPPASAPLPAESHHHTPPRSHGKSVSQSGFVPTQSPLQAVEYNTPPPASRPYPDHYSPSPQSGYSSGRVDGPRVPRPRESFDTHTPPRPVEDRGYGQSAPVSPYDQPSPRRQPSPLPEHHELPSGEELRQPAPFEDGRPPPPPAHRSRHNSGGQELTHRGYDTSPQKSTPSMQMRQDVLKSEAHRHSSPSYPGRPTFRPYEPTMSSPNQSEPQNTPPYESSSPRYHSYDAPYDQQYRSMQPTVEDVPESPPGPLASPYKHHGRNRMNSHDEMMFQTNATPVPLNLSRSPGGSSYPPSQSPGHYHPVSYQEHPEPPASVSPLSARDYSNSPIYPQQNSQSYLPSPRRDFEPSHARNSPSYGTPDVPSSLSPGMDPALSQEIAEQIYEERRYDSRGSRYPQQMTTPTRGRHHSEGPPSYGTSPNAYATQGYNERSAVTYSGSPDTQMVLRRREVSPNPNVQHTIRRKSVSPAPPPSENRRASDIPFGPDSYDALNPSLASPSVAGDGTGRAHPDDKIITHDGREIDPSDHLPMESWAPEPEPKGSKEPSPEPRSRPSPAGAQPMPPSGRRPLRVAARPQSMAALPAPSYGYNEDHRAPPAPTNGGRNRLQKKAHRGSAGPGPSPGMSSPLAPVSTDNYQDRQGQYTPSRGPRRGHSFDYPNENHHPHYASGPPIPAKVPLPVMSGANGGVDQALMQEMQRIDIGTGRSRRRGGY